MYSAISGGQDNTAPSGANYASIGGGRYNNANYEYSTVGGGFSNSANANYATIGGGGRSIPDDPSTGNRVTDDYGTIGGGGSNLVGDDNGDVSNARFATVSGGFHNQATGPYATVGGGYSNQATGLGTTVSGGDQNKAIGMNSTVSGGDRNKAIGSYSTVSGGFYNQANGASSMVPGGEHNEAIGLFSFAAGNKAKANGRGSFVWGDSNQYELHAWNANEFVCRATGGFWFITKVDDTGYPLEGMQLPAGKSVWVPIGSTTSSISQEQDERVQRLEEENALLKQRIDNLESRLSALEKLVSAAK
jgi:hypothetical protein